MDLIPIILKKDPREKWKNGRIWKPDATEKGRMEERTSF